MNESLGAYLEPRNIGFHCKIERKLQNINAVSKSQFSYFNFIPLNLLVQISYPELKKTAIIPLFKSLR